jgi:hypothetical protein
MRLLFCYVVTTIAFILTVLGQVALWKYNTYCQTSSANIIKHEIVYQTYDCTCSTRTCRVSSCDVMKSQQRDGPCCNGRCQPNSWEHCAIRRSFQITVDIELIEPQYHETLRTTQVYESYNGFISDQELLTYVSQGQRCWYTRNGMGMGNDITLHFGQEFPINAYIILPLFAFLCWVVANNLLFCPKRRPPLDATTTLPSHETAQI